MEEGVVKSAGPESKTAEVEDDTEDALEATEAV